MKVAVVLLFVSLTLFSTALVFDEALSVQLIDDIDSERGGRLVEKRAVEFALPVEDDVHSDHGHTGSDETQPTDEWVVQIDGGEQSAAILARGMGFEIAGQVNISIKYELPRRQPQQGKQFHSSMIHCHQQVNGFGNFYRLRRSLHLARPSRNEESSSMSSRLADDTRVFSLFSYFS